MKIVRVMSGDFYWLVRLFDGERFLNYYLYQDYVINLPDKDYRNLLDFLGSLTKRTFIKPIELEVYGFVKGV